MPFHFSDKGAARRYFADLRQIFVDWNYSAWKSPEFAENEKKLDEKLSEA